MLSTRGRLPLPQRYTILKNAGWAEHRDMRDEDSVNRQPLRDQAEALGRAGDTESDYLKVDVPGAICVHLCKQPKHLN